MNSIRVGAVILLAGWLGIGVASGQVLYTTQTDFTPAVGLETDIVTEGATGDTDGSTVNGLATDAGGSGTAGALSILHPALGYKQTNLGGENGNAPFLAALKANSKMALDYTLAQDLATGANGYFQISGVFNFTGNYLGFNNNAFFNGANLLAGKHTVVYDYSQHKAALPAAPSGALTYFELFLVLNSGGSLSPGSNVQVYIDNIRLVPEPGSLTLTGLIAPALLLGLRRRNKK
jgi:hypothetical protein